MKTAVITTTINVPRVLELYPTATWDMLRLFVAGDLKTPREAQPFCELLRGCVYLSPEHQKDLNYKSSELIGWNTDSRRNIALLEAIKWGAELIVSIDDDMIPAGLVLTEFERIFICPFSGLELGSLGRWLDAGAFTIPAARQRGLPVDTIFDATPGFVSNASIGAAQGIILGVPDTDACTAIANTPHVHSATDILRNGFVADLDAYTVFNSQLTAFRRELAPCFAQFYKWQGRNTDIIASVLMRRVMQDRGLYTYFGPPMGYHARAKRPLLNDLKAEMRGLTNINADLYTLEGLLDASDPLETCRFFWDSNETPELREAGLAWCDDIESVQ